MKEPEKLPALSFEHKEALALLASKPEFKAQESLFKIEESNIIIQSFKTLSSDPDLVRKKAFLEGRLHELRKITRTYEEVKKGKEEE